ncbi:MAG: hypothetical protein LCH53_09465 [Bacteroidetes bacterium]|nr:hypothetical protein [Bacteroidota bacterium]
MLQHKQLTNCLASGFSLVSDVPPPFSGRVFLLGELSFRDRMLVSDAFRSILRNMRAEAPRSWRDDIKKLYYIVFLKGDRPELVMASAEEAHEIKEAEDCCTGCAIYSIMANVLNIPEDDE